MGARRRWVTIGVLVLVGLIGLIFALYWFNWDWTGFNEHIGPRVPQYQPTKNALGLATTPGYPKCSSSYSSIKTRCRWLNVCRIILL